MFGNASITQNTKRSDVIPIIPEIPTGIQLELVPRIPTNINVVLT